MSKSKGKKQIVKDETKHNISLLTTEDLQAYIHKIHNFLRNNGVGYGKSGMMVFNVFYGLKLIQSRLDTFNLSEHQRRILDFDELKNKISPNNIDHDHNNLVGYIDREILEVLWSLKKSSDPKLSGLGYFLFHQIPRDIVPQVWADTINMIDVIPVGYKASKGEQKKVNLAGKVYEYFVGRDKQAISELGAYFTDRHITEKIYDKLNIKLNKDKSIGTMIDPFGGSGGFTLGYADYLNKHFDIDWKKNINNIYHFDMEDSVVSMTGLEMFALTGEFPKRDYNYKRINTFTDNFISENNDSKRYKYVISNPPYGGDDTDKTPEQIIRDKLTDYIKKMHPDDFKNNNQYKRLMQETKIYNEEQKKTKVNLATCSKRFNEFCKKHKITTANNKEACSLLLLADLLEENGTCAAVLKEGVFFDGKYSLHRKVILDNYNITNIISIPKDQFENTTTKTSVIIFHNNGRTENIKFSEYKVVKQDDDVITVNEDGEYLLEKIQGSIKYVEENELCSASYEDICKPKIIKNKKGKETEKYDYSWNSKNYKKYKVKCPKGYELKRITDIEEIKFNPKSKRLAEFANDTGKYHYYSSGTTILKCDIADFNNELSIIIGHSGNGCLFLDNTFSTLVTNHVLQSKNNYLLMYIFNYLKYYWNSFYDLSYHGSTVKNTSNEHINNYKIAFPTDINKLKKPLDALYKLHQQITLETESIPEKEKHIMDLIKKLTDEGKKGVDYDNKNFNELVEFQKKLIKYKASHGKKEGKYHFYTSSQEKILFIDEEPLFTDTMLIMGRNGDMSVHYDKNFSCENDHVYVMKINDIDTRYMYYYIYLNRLWFKEQMNGSTIDGTSKEILGKFTVKALKPSIMKKHKLQELFDEVDELRQSLVDNKAKYDEKLKELFKDFDNQDNDEEETDDNDETDEEDSEEESEREIITYKDKQYIVEDTIMYNIKKDGSKGIQVGTWINGKFKKTKKEEILNV